MEQLTKYSSFTSQWASNLAIKLSFFFPFQCSFFTLSTFSWSKSLCSRKCPNYSDLWTNWGRVKFSWQQWTPQQTFLALGEVTGGQFVPSASYRGLVLAQGKPLWFDCHSIDEMFGVTLCIDFSSLPLTSLDVFLNNWCILNVPAAPAGRWHCHMVSSSTCEPRVCFSQDVLDRSHCKVSVLSSMQGWSCPVVASDKAAPQLPRTVVPYWGLCCSLRAAPDTLVCQWCPSTVSEQPLALS